MSLSNKRIIFCLTLSLASAGLCSCSPSITHYSGTAYGYGTTWDIHLYQGSQKDVDEIVSYITKTSQVLDTEKTSCVNGVYTLNEKGTVEGDPFLLEAFSLANRVKDIAPDTFSYSLGALTSAWLESLDQGKVLDEATKSTLLEQAKATSVSIEGSTVSKVGLGQIDLGSIGKGLCLNKLKKTLDEKGIKQYLINGGSSSILVGETPNSDGNLKVYLEDAKPHYFYVKNLAISASSVSKQGVKIDGKTYSHIIDPRNGNANLEYDALYMLGEDAGLLDGLTTSFLVLGEQGKEKLNQLGVKYAFCKDGKVVYANEEFIR